MVMQESNGVKEPQTEPVGGGGRTRLIVGSATGRTHLDTMNSEKDCVGNWGKEFDPVNPIEWVSNQNDMAKLPQSDSPYHTDDTGLSDDLQQQDATFFNSCQTEPTVGVVPLALGRSAEKYPSMAQTPQGQSGRQKKVLMPKKSKELQKKLKDVKLEVEFLRRENKRYARQNKAWLEMAEYAKYLERVVLPRKLSHCSETPVAEISSSDGNLKKMDADDKREADDEMRLLGHEYSVGVQAALDITSFVWRYPILPSKEILEHAAKRMLVDHNAAESPILVSSFQTKMKSVLAKYQAGNEEEAVKRIRHILTCRLQMSRIMVRLAPNIVFKRLTRGWISQQVQKYADMKEVIVLPDQSINALIDELNLSNAQKYACADTWNKFVESWNAARDCNGADFKLEDDAFWHDLGNPMGGYSTTKAAQDSLQLHSFVNSTREKMYQQSRLMLNMIEKLVHIIGPIGIAKLLTFYPGELPCFVCIGKMISISSSNNTKFKNDGGHIIFEEPPPTTPC